MSKKRSIREIRNLNNILFRIFVKVTDAREYLRILIICEIFDIFTIKVSIGIYRNKPFNQHYSWHRFLAHPEKMDKKML